MKIPGVRSSAAVVFLGFLACCGQTLAGAPPTGSAPNFVEFRAAYVSAGNTENQFDAASPRYDLSYGHGYGLAAIYGRQFGQFHGTVEVDYLRSGPETSFPGAGVQFTTRDRYTLWLAGIFYDFPSTNRLSFALGGGGGLVSRHATLVRLLPLPIRSGEINDNSFGVFGELNATYRLTDTVSGVAALRAVVHNDPRSTHSTNFWVGLRLGF